MSSGNENCRSSIGRNIAQRALEFIGTPYDPDPLGTYVREKVVVCDDKVDCMYLVFRSVEKALCPGNEIDAALYFRFKTRGILKDGLVTNYEDRFQYGVDMIHSGKWGVDVTCKVGPLSLMPPATRGRLSSPDYRGPVAYAPKELLFSVGRTETIASGDIIFFVVKERSADYSESIGHMGIAVVDDTVSLVHASGTKDADEIGEVRKDPLRDYLLQSRFSGIKITRFVRNPSAGRALST